MKITKNSQKSELKKGTKITRTTVRRLSATKHKTEVENYTVTGHFNAKSGSRIRLLSEYGHGVNDVDFEHKPNSPAIISTEWTTN